MVIRNLTPTGRVAFRIANVMVINRDDGYRGSVRVLPLIDCTHVSTMCTACFPSWNTDHIITR